MKTLKTDVEKGSMRTAIGHGLVDEYDERGDLERLRPSWKLKLIENVRGD